MPDSPYRNPALRIELGQRVLEALMTVDDWTDIMLRYLEMELAPYMDNPDA